MTRVTNTHFEKASQLLFVRSGSNMSRPVLADDDEERLGRLLEQCPIGGLVLFNGDLASTPASLARLQSRSRRPLLVAADVERGVGQQIEGATEFPHAMALSQLGDAGVRLSEAVGRATAREALACGIHMILGPVCDVNKDPDNPIIATRSFGHDADRVAALASAYVRGCRSEGALTVAKHFPGHGDTSTDSHTDVPVIHRNYEAMKRNDLLPFSEAISAGVNGVMTAHAAYPELDSSGSVATASAEILRRILRQELGFQGAVMTDSLRMAGITSAYASEGEMAVDLLRAGQNLLLDVQDPVAVASAIADAVERGELEETVLDESLIHLDKLRAAVSSRSGFRTLGSPAPPLTSRELSEHVALAEAVAERALFAGVDSKCHDVCSPASAILFKPFANHRDGPVEPLGMAIRQRLGADRYHQIGPDVSQDELRRILQSLGNEGPILVALIVKPSAWNPFGLPDTIRNFIDEVSATFEVKIVSLGSPEILKQFPEVEQRLCAYSDVPPSQEAVFRLFFSSATLTESA